MPAKSRSYSPSLVIVFTLILAIILNIGSLFMPTRVSASSSSPTLQVNAGFGTYFRIGAWVPLYITLHNNGPDFNGLLTTSNPEGFVWQDTYSMVPSSIYQQPVMVPHGSQKQVTLYLPITAQSSMVNIIVQLLDSYGKV